MRSFLWKLLQENIEEMQNYSIRRTKILIFNQAFTSQIIFSKWEALFCEYYI